MGWLGRCTATTPLQAAMEGNCRPLRTSAKRKSCRILSRRNLGGKGKGKEEPAGERHGARLTRPHPHPPRPAPPRRALEAAGAEAHVGGGAGGPVILDGCGGVRVGGGGVEGNVVVKGA